MRIHIQTKNRSFVMTVVCSAVALTLLISSRAIADPWADLVVGYDPGIGAAAGFGNSSVALGSPERFTGEGVFPGAVTMFNSAFVTD